MLVRQRRYGGVGRLPPARVVLELPPYEDWQSTGGHSRDCEAHHWKHNRHSPFLLELDNVFFDADTNGIGNYRKNNSEFNKSS